MQRIWAGDIDTFKPIPNELFVRNLKISYAVYFDRVDLENCGCETCETRIPAQDRSRGRDRRDLVMRLWHFVRRAVRLRNSWKSDISTYMKLDTARMAFGSTRDDPRSRCVVDRNASGLNLSRGWRITYRRPSSLHLQPRRNT